MVRVRLRGVDLAAHLAMMQHHDAVLRELSLTALDEDAVAPRPLAERFAAVAERLDRLTRPLDDAARTAAAAGLAAFDVDATLPVRVVASAAELRDLFDEADERCRRGRLLTVAPSPAVTAHRRWLTERLLAHLPAPPPGG